MRLRNPLPEDLPFSVRARKVNWVVGMIALFLPVLLLLSAMLPRSCYMYSISHYYYTRVGGDILVGALCIIGVTMIFFYEYKGKALELEDRSLGLSRYPAHNNLNWWLSKAAGACALGVAFFPTGGFGCQYPGPGTGTGNITGNIVSRFLLTGTTADGPVHVPRGADLPSVSGTVTQDFWSTFGWWAEGQAPFILQYAHYISAGLMFTILGYFSFFVFTRVQTPASTKDRSMTGAPTDEKRVRNWVYRAMGLLIFGSILAMGIKMGLASFILNDADALDFIQAWDTGRWTFKFEALALISFGISWMLKGKFLGILADPPAP